MIFMSHIIPVTIMSRFLYFILLFSIVAQQVNGNGSVPVGASLTATNNGIPWLSPSGDFAFGFQQTQGKDAFLLAIWFDKIPEKTVVWYPKGGPMVPRGSKVKLTNGIGLVLSDPQGKAIWTSGSISDLAYGFMNDTGNFVVVDSNNRKMWESFSFPADTILPAQVMERAEELNSKISKTNFTTGRFTLILLPDGNLILRKRDILSGISYNTYYRSGTRNDSNTTISGLRFIFDETGYMYILRRNGQIFEVNRKDALPSRDYYQRATLDSDGVFTQYYYPKNPTGNTSWNVSWSLPKNICNSITGTSGSGACGLNAVCSLDGNLVNCECPHGFSLLDPNDPNGDCKPNFTPTCDEGYDRDQFDFIELNNIDWPGSDYVHVNPTNEESCKTFCLQDCFCAVAIYGDFQCWKKRLPLSNGKKDPSQVVKAFLKSRKGDIPHQTPSVILREQDNNQRSLIFVVVSTCVFIIFILAGVICVGFFRIYKKTTKYHHLISNKSVDTSLPRFTYQELVEATGGFKDELGKGAFGIVYKGVIGVKTMAVKKLERVLQDGEKEFQTEVNAIAKTHHKNLVQLLGYCNEGEQRLLIYEYMCNGTLAAFLFGEMRPSWNLRSCIVLGIAKGLSYLHEECSTQVIHCDIKPQNILLDDCYNAKISDFGLAKLLMMNQSRTSTGIRGTKGYVAPEWFRNTPVTTKVDVYSFGVLLLEIISCRKSVISESDYEGVAVLTDWAWDCYQDGRLEVFLENDIEALDDYKRLTTFVMVGLWCVQENPSLRPTMRKVIQMLEGVVEVIEPPCPFPFSVTN
ncbi:hypothetical protein L1987_75220 [Smallanthus sonchifolius]|uniref:Uncharacterized protein n=1 Tax=Smallanthus sonchifolius TaxID=185202 RepID=A0ACB9A4Y0_9ASTR|nr:hypothetical protein L1987_75220 [Smallanthus sonchifolius]